MTYSLALTLVAGPLRGDDLPSTRGADDLDSRERQAQRDVELALIRRIQNGDADAFRTLVVSYFDRTSRFAFGLVRDRETAEDIAQEIFTHLWANHSDWQPRSSIVAYLFRAARNRSLNALKHHGVEARFAEASQQLSEDTADSAEMEIEAAQIFAALRHALDELPDRRRSALTLRYEYGLSHAEIGETLGITPKASRELIARTLESLRVRLQAFR